MVVDGQLVFAVVATNAEGRVMLTGPRIAAYNVGSRVTAIDWASPTTLMLARDSPESPVLQLSINGTPGRRLCSAATCHPRPIGRRGCGPPSTSATAAASSASAAPTANPTNTGPKSRPR